MIMDWTFPSLVHHSFGLYFGLYYYYSPDVLDDLYETSSSDSSMDTLLWIRTRFDGQSVPHLFHTRTQLIRTNKMYFLDHFGLSCTLSPISSNLL